ncbi:MAG: acetate--CoA ligase family protein [Anaerolineales bacterium]|nr:acetate--CoA ligase family protein [Anaerolineales bacterium]
MIEQMLAPRGVAVVGASQNPTKLGYGVARNLVVSGYGGAVHFVNPHGGRLFNLPIHTDLESVPDPVDLAMIIIPAAAVPEALEACGRRGIHFAIIGSGGFRETGPEGMALEERCLEIARAHDIRLLGPNCIGFLDTHLPIDTTFLPLPGPIQGDIAFLSHSGAICEAVIDWARGQGFGLSRLVSLGNQLDLTEAELLPTIVDDRNTQVVAMYLEGVRDGARFVEQARLATRRKPVLAIKVGRSAQGRAAVASHTGALAGRDVAYDAAFRKAGVIRGESTEEVFDWARALAWCRLPQGPRTAVLTNAGGPGAIAADALDAVGLQLATFSEATQAALRSFLPEAASVRNPVDMLAAAGPYEYANGLGALLADEGVDSVMVIMAPPPMTTAAGIAGAILPLIRSASKPVVVSLMGEEMIANAARLFRQARVPEYRFPERAASALRVLVRRAEQLETPLAEPEMPAGIDLAAARRLLASPVSGGDGFLDGRQAELLLKAYGIPVPETVLATTPEEAEAASRRMPGSVALKVASPDIVHKSDAGGVLLDLIPGEPVRLGFRSIQLAAQVAFPEARLEGVLVQPMAPKGQDVIVGVVRDSQFGPLVMFGSGGVEVEGLQDVSFALAPLSRGEAHDLMQATWAGRRLAGFRNLPPADRQAAVEVILRIGQLMVDQPEVEEVEVNPLRVFPEGQGALALDVRLRLRA